MPPGCSATGIEVQELRTTGGLASKGATREVVALGKPLGIPALASLGVLALCAQLSCSPSLL